MYIVRIIKLNTLNFFKLRFYMFAFCSFFAIILISYHDIRF